MADYYDYNYYSLQKSGLGSFVPGVPYYYNSSSIWTCNPSMRTSPTSSVLTTSSRFSSQTAPEMRTFGSLFGRDAFEGRQDTVSSSGALYQKTKQVLGSIPAVFESRISKEKSASDLRRYNNWQPKSIDPNVCVQYLSLPAKPVSVFQTGRSQGALPGSPGVHKHRSADALNQTRDAAAIQPSELVSGGRAFPAIELSHADNPRSGAKSTNETDYAARAFSYYGVSQTDSVEQRLDGGNDYESRKRADDLRNPAVDIQQSTAPKQGIYVKRTATQNTPKDSGHVAHRPLVDSAAKLPPPTLTAKLQSPPTSSAHYNDIVSKSFGYTATENQHLNDRFQANIHPAIDNDMKMNSPSESPVKRNPPASGSAPPPVSPPKEFGLSRYMRGPQPPSQNDQNKKQTTSIPPPSKTDEKDLINDAFRFLDDFEEDGK